MRALTQIGAFYSHLLPELICIWLSVWAIRKKAEVDEPLDRGAKILRWTIIVVAFGTGCLPGESLRVVRICGFWVGLSFLCWPNLAYHLRNLFKREPTIGT